MVAPTQRDGRRWRGLALTTVTVLALHIALLEIPVRQSRETPTIGKIMVTRRLTDQAQKSTPDQTLVAQTQPESAPPEAAVPKTLAPQSDSVDPPLSASNNADAAAIQAVRPAPTSTTVSAPPEEPPPKLQVPPSVTLRYRGTERSRSVDQGVESTLTWEQDGSVYSAKFETTAGARTSRSQTSVGKLGPEGLLPERYADRRRTEQATHFLRDAGLIRFSANAADTPLSTGAQDHLSVIFQLAGLLAGNAAIRNEGRHIKVQTATTRSSDVWTFEIVSGSTVDDNAEVHLRRISGSTYDEALEIWLAPNIGFMPRRIRITYSNGDFIDQELAFFRE